MAGKGVKRGAAVIRNSTAGKVKSTAQTPAPKVKAQKGARMSGKRKG